MMCGFPGDCSGVCPKTQSCTRYAICIGHPDTTVGQQLLEVCTVCLGTLQTVATFRRPQLTAIRPSAFSELAGIAVDLFRLPKPDRTLLAENGRARSLLCPGVRQSLSSVCQRVFGIRPPLMGRKMRFSEVYGRRTANSGDTLDGYGKQRNGNARRSLPHPGGEGR